MTSWRGTGACRVAPAAPRSQHAGTRSPAPGGLPTTSRSTPPRTAAAGAATSPSSLSSPSVPFARSTRRDQVCKDGPSQLPSLGNARVSGDPISGHDAFGKQTARMASWRGTTDRSTSSMEAVRTNKGPKILRRSSFGEGPTCHRGPRSKHPGVNHQEQAHDRESRLQRNGQPKKCWALATPKRKVSSPRMARTDRSNRLANQPCRKRRRRNSLKQPERKFRHESSARAMLWYVPEAAHV